LDLLVNLIIWKYLVRNRNTLKTYKHSVIYLIGPRPLRHLGNSIQVKQNDIFETVWSQITELSFFVLFIFM
jgi:hypothetical protein